MSRKLKANEAKLASKILALGCTIQDTSPSNKAKVQAGIFLSKLLRLKATGKEVNLMEQPGYRFMWLKRPMSEELSGDWRNLRDQIRFASLSDIFPPVENRFCIRLCKKLHFGPDEELAESGRWATGISSVAYLTFAGDWRDDKAFEEIRKSLGKEVAEYYDEMKMTLYNLGL